MKKILSILTAVFSCFAASAFDWPQAQVVQSDQFYSYFGQLRGDTISTSLIFSDPTEIKASEKGSVTIVINEYADSTDFFPSTLGNAVIIAHADSMLTVYGNLSTESTGETLELPAIIAGGTPLGYSGNSAWQQGHSSLEFQVIDTKNNTAINPRLLMPRVGKELPLYYNEVSLQNKNGRFFNASVQNVLPSGVYRVYKKRQATATPYKTRVSVNGTVLDQVSYDLLRQEDNLLCASGKKNYPKSVLYPTDDLQLLGEVSLTPGKNALQLSLSDILGKETNATYLITIY